MFIRLSEAGDTIVEVLIVLAVLGLSLGISYATANRSLLGARQAQEHSEALEILQGQLEQLRANAANDPNLFDISKYSSGFCYTPSFVDLTITPGGCTMQTLYGISLKHFNGNSNAFQATASWDDVTGRGKDNVSLVYRLYP